jgi:hypothetical protein
MMQRDSTCPSKLQLERVLHGEIAGQVEATLNRHLDSCASCRDWLEAARSETKRLGVEVDSSAFADRVARRLGDRERQAPRGDHRDGWLQRWLVGYKAAWLGLAAAALAGLLLMTTFYAQPPGEPAIPTTRIKGSSFVRLHLKRGHDVRVLTPEARTRAGDAIRFEVFPGAHGYVMVLALRSDGHVSVYAPFDGEQSLPVTPHHRHLLDGSIVLEGKRDELLIVVLSDAPVAADAATAAVEAAFGRAGGRLDRTHGLNLDATVHLRLLHRAKEGH